MENIVTAATTIKSIEESVKPVVELERQMSEPDDVRLLKSPAPKFEEPALEIQELPESPSSFVPRDSPYSPDSLPDLQICLENGSATVDTEKTLPYDEIDSAVDTEKTLPYDEIDSAVDTEKTLPYFSPKSLPDLQRPLHLPQQFLDDEIDSAVEKVKTSIMDILQTPKWMVVKTKNDDMHLRKRLRIEGKTLIETKIIEMISVLRDKENLEEKDDNCSYLQIEDLKSNIMNLLQITVNKLTRTNDVN